MSAHRPDDGPVVLGLLRTAGLELALPLSVLREVVPCPRTLDPLPVDVPGLLGALTLRGTVVPVLDAARLAGRDHELAEGQVVVVLVSRGRLLGLLADQVRGLASVQPAQTTQVACEGADLLFSHTFQHPHQGHVVSVLDPDVVLGLPGVPVVREAGPATGTGKQAVAGRPPSRSLTVVRCGDHLLAIDVEHVHSTIPAPVLRPSVVDGPTCLGTTPVAGAEVAVADLLALLGLGTMSGTPMSCGLVLELPDGQVVLGVSEMVGLRDVLEEHIVALPASASPAPRLLPQVADVDGVGACLLVEGGELRSGEAVRVLSRVVTASDGGAGAGDPATAASAGPPHLAYRAGVDLATPLSQVVEVLGFPADLVRSSSSPQVLGVVLHRGTAVPVLCLATVLGRQVPEYGDGSRLLLVHVDGTPVAWAVTALHAILPLVWQDADGSGARTSRAGGELSTCPLVQLSTMAGLLPAVDLERLAGTALGPAPAAVPLQRGTAGAQGVADGGGRDRQRAGA